MINMSIQNQFAQNMAAEKFQELEATSEYKETYYYEDKSLRG